MLDCWLKRQNIATYLVAVLMATMSGCQGYKAGQQPAPPSNASITISNVAVSAVTASEATVT
jgi:hypothetical protein